MLCYCSVSWLADHTFLLYFLYFLKFYFSSFAIPFFYLLFLRFCYFRGIVIFQLAEHFVCVCLDVPASIDIAVSFRFYSFSVFPCPCLVQVSYKIKKDFIFNFNVFKCLFIFLFLIPGRTQPFFTLYNALLRFVLTHFNNLCPDIPQRYRWWA